MTLKQIKNFIKKHGFYDIDNVYCYNTKSYFIDSDEVLGLYLDINTDTVYAYVINDKEETKFISLSEELLTDILLKK